MSIQMHIPKPPSLKELRLRRRPVKNVNVQHEESLTGLERAATWVSDHVGTPGFFVIILLWTIGWLGWNSLAPRRDRFDPFPAFVLWLFISNMIQIFLMPLIMVAQNLQSRHAEMRAENDFHVNVKAEQEVETILHHLEYQNTILLGMVQKMGMTIEECVQCVNGAPNPSLPDANAAHVNAANANAANANAASTNAANVNAANANAAPEA